MSTFWSICLSVGLLFLLIPSIAFACSGKSLDVCYCDSSTGRNVLNSGSYSTTYCTRRAVMNLQKLEGCCMWHGGVLKTTVKDGVQCRDGSVSEFCTRQIPHDKVSVY